MALKEPIVCFVTIPKVIKKVTVSGDIDVIMTLKVSDYGHKKAEVMRLLADIEADEYFQAIIRNEGKNG